MPDRAPLADIDPKFSGPQAEATPWSQARDVLAAAELYWISTVRPDGRPHVTPIAAVWFEDALYFTTGLHERKAQNLKRNRQCVVTTGTNAFQGLDVVVEGDAVRMSDEPRLRRLADAYVAKYGQLFVFEVRDGTFHADDSPDPGLVFEIRATKAFGFAKGEPFSQTRYRFQGR